MVCASGVSHAQKWAVSTNALTWLNLGTINAECSVSVHDHVSVNAGFVANPWSMTTPTYVELKNGQYGGYVGAKYWPWHVYSEWWVGAKVQYKNFEHVGLLSPNLMEGHALGAGFSGGYSLMIGNHVNLDFGLGFWGGRCVKYTEYKGQYRNEMKILSQRPRYFFFLDNIMVALVYIF